jgi:hypothetical protein
MARNGGPIQLVAQGAAPENAWRLSSHFVTASGHRPTAAQLAAFLRQHCPGIGPPPAAPPQGHALASGAGGPQAFEACRQQAAKVFHLFVTYQPAGRYWTFQWLETAIFVALALLAAAGCFWWVTRRTT